MKYKHIKSDEVEKKDFGSVIVQELLDDERYEKATVAIVKIIRGNKLELNKKCDMIDYVLEGKGKFVVESEEIDVQKGDLVFVPKETKYKHDGDMTLLAISTPKFDRDKVVHFDE